MPILRALASIAFLNVASAWNPWHYHHHQHDGHFQGESEDCGWNGWGGDLFNSRHAHRSVLNPSNADSVVIHCKIEYTNGVSATPTIDGDIAYYPTWGGSLVALNYKTCQTVWEMNVTRVAEDFAPITDAQALVASPVSRTSPYLYDGVLYLGTQIHALLLAVDASTGTLIAQIQVNSHPLAVITQSPTVYDGHILVGASSVEESAAASVPGYKCCSFVGNMDAYTLSTSKRDFTRVWSVSMLPDPPGNWSGNAVWGSQPSIDEVRGQLFIATGNVYTAPKEFSECAESTKKGSSCLPPNVYQEAVMALDIKTGHINWANQISPLDAWTVACIPGAATPSNQVNCPPAPGPDADFGMAPAFVPAAVGDTPGKEDIVVVGQKNGNLYAISAATGKIMWATSTSPDGVAGGLSWGVAVDGSQVYFTAINFNSVPWRIEPSMTKINNSAWGAEDLQTGRVKWDTQSLPATSQGYVPPTIANGVVITGRTQLTTEGPGSMAGGMLVMLEAATGKMLHSLDLDVDYHGGIAVMDEYLVFGTGYQNAFFNTTGSLYVAKVSGL